MRAANPSGPVGDPGPVALSFDDGPVAATADLLDLLRATGVHATFFLVGSNGAEYPAIVRRMVAEGHAVGNHTYTHSRLTGLGLKAVRRELIRTNDAISKATGHSPKLFRPPYGATDPTVERVTAELGMAQILWSVDPMDWQDRNSDTVTERVLAGTKAGSIVLSHDIHETTRAAYAGIVEGLLANGFTPVTVPELLGEPLAPGRKYSSG